MGNKEKEKEKNKKTSMYCNNPEYVYRALRWETPNRDLPIFENGSSRFCRSLKGQKYTLVQTCAFDSIFQVLLFAFVNDGNFRKTVSK